VVNLVHVFVQRAPVEGTVGPVMPGILHDEEDGDLVGHLGPGGEGNAGLHAEVHAHRMEQPDLRELDGEVTEQDQLGALPLLGGRGNLGLTKILELRFGGRRTAADTDILDLPPPEVGNGINNDPW
jgi:hypothetical protein